jgi:predicted enzyme related to lactoylglutathione lyase
MNQMNPVTHFEMPYENRERAVDFYAKTFGWKANLMGPEMGNYVVVDTSERDEKTQFPKNPGMINGGLFEKNKSGSQTTSVVIAVENIRAAMKRITDGGGKVLGEPVEIPGTGLYVSFIDTEGNYVSIIEPKAM